MLTSERELHLQGVSEDLNCITVFCCFWNNQTIISARPTDWIFVYRLLVLYTYDLVSKPSRKWQKYFVIFSIIFKLFRCWRRDIPAVGSIPCLLMLWLLKSPEHKRAWYSLCMAENMHCCSRQAKVKNLECRSKRLTGFSRIHIFHMGTQRLLSKECFVNASRITLMTLCWHMPSLAHFVC